MTDTQDEPKKSLEERIKEEVDNAVKEEEREITIKRTTRKSFKRSNSKKSQQSNNNKRERKTSRHSSKDNYNNNNNNDTSSSLNQFNLTVLPIITHTCATPILTPSSSNRNIILAKIMKQNSFLKLQRSMSFDSSIDCYLNVYIV